MYKFLEKTYSSILNRNSQIELGNTWQARTLKIMQDVRRSRTRPPRAGARPPSGWMATWAGPMTGPTHTRPIHTHALYNIIGGGPWGLWVFVSADLPPPPLVKLTLH